MNGWSLVCPVCWRKVAPANALLSEVMPRLAYHLWDEHDLEAAFLRIHLNNPPAEWPVLEAAP